jgi:hypothetical protein
MLRRRVELLVLPQRAWWRPVRRRPSTPRSAVAAADWRTGGTRWRARRRILAQPYAPQRSVQYLVMMESGVRVPASTCVGSNTLQIAVFGGPPSRREHITANDEAGLRGSPAGCATELELAILQALPHLEPGRWVSREAEKRMTSRELAHAWHTEPCPHEALRLSRRPTNGRRTLLERGADLNWAGYDD